MSELKAYIAPMPDGTGLADYYLKSEADKVITDKDKEISELQAMLEERNKQVAELKSDTADLRDDKKLTDAILDERNAEIAELKSKIESADRQVENLINSATDIMLRQDKVNDTKCDELRHQKYKRCLAMADFCESQHDYYNTLGNGFWLVRGDVKTRDKYRKRASDFWWKWHKRWLELAEKFKEAK